MSETSSTLTDNPFGRLAGVLVSPQATFRSIAGRPTWGVALVVVALVVLAGQMAVFDKVDTGEVRAEMERQIEARGQQMSDEQLDTALDVQMKVGMACGALFLPLMMLGGALVLMVLTNLLGGELRYVEALAVLAHAMVPLALSALLVVLVTMGMESIPFSDVQEGRVLASNLAYFAPSDTPLPLLAALSQVDLFALWSVALVIVGLTAVGGLSTTTAAVLAAVLYLLLVGLRAGLAALGQMGGGG